MRKLNTEQFIIKAKKVHPDKNYDYSLVNYKNSKTKVTIICEVHGEYTQSPDHHLMGKGCKKCAHESISLSTDEFITKANRVHKFKFSYEKAVYRNSFSIVTITCPKHGDFEQNAKSHLAGYGCRLCAGNERDSFASLSGKVESIHKGSISLLEGQTIINNASKYKFLHKTCGHIWDSSANSVLSGTGCPKCAGNSPYDRDSLVKALFSVHAGDVQLVEGQAIQGVGNKYYFKHSCGHIWKATANHILRGSSCPNCSEHGFNSLKEAIFYILPIRGNSNFTGFGISNNYPKRRSQHSNNLKLEGCYIDSGEITILFSKGADALRLESHVKSILGRHGVSNVSGFKTESTTLSVKELVNICNEWIRDMAK